MRSLLTAFLVWGLACAGAAAREANTEENPQAAPGSLAIGMLENAEAIDLFEVLPDAQIRIRHNGSGLICRFDLEPGGRVVVFPGLPRGDDVGCDSDIAGADLTLYATRYPEPTNVNEQVSGAIAAIRQRFNDVQPYDPGFEMTSEAVAESLSAHFSLRMERRRMYSRVSVAMIDGWVIKMRYTAPASNEDDLHMQALMSSAIWMQTLLDFLPPKEE